MIRTLNIGDRVRPGEYRVHSRFPAVVNFISGEELVSLVTQRVGAGPINIVLSGLEAARSERLSVRRTGIELDGLPLPDAPLYDSGLPPAAGPDRDRLESGLRELSDLICAAAHPKSLAFLLAPRRRSLFRCGFENALAQRLQTGALAVMRGDLEQGARTLSGTGFGLTPSGDDFLAGHMWGLHARRVLWGEDRSADIARLHIPNPAANPLSRAFLRCAREGRFFARLKDMLASLIRGDTPRTAAHARELLAAGETSGADVAVGFLVAAQKEAITCS